MNNIISEVNVKTASMLASEDIPRKEFKKPVDIGLKTTTGNFIVHEATSEKSYDKLYYTTPDKFKSGDTAYRIKHVQLPLNRDKTKFTNVHALWEHLQRNCNYKPI